MHRHLMLLFFRWLIFIYTLHDAWNVKLC
jgi:hypothetical protein